MFKKSDPYTYASTRTLLDDSRKEGQKTVGTITNEHIVSRYEDIRNSQLSPEKNSTHRKFLLHSTQKINMFNEDGLIISPNQNITFNNYPALLYFSLGINPVSGMGIELLGYTPKTVNTKIQSSGSSGTAESNSQNSSATDTVGSSTSQTNSYSTSVSIDGASASYDHSTTHTDESSHSDEHGSMRGHSQNVGSEDSMSIKDWGSYALYNPSSQELSWVFGQEYPWDAIGCRKQNGEIYSENKNQIGLQIPKGMLARLSDVNILNPPSQLSMFGYEFIAKSLWLLTVENTQAAQISFKQFITCSRASHTFAKANVVKVYIDKEPEHLDILNATLEHDTIDLSALSLDPIGKPLNKAVVGFLAKNFTIAPRLSTVSTPPSQFEIVAATNNLIVKDQTTYPVDCGDNGGFENYRKSLKGRFSEKCPILIISIFFKILDHIDNYTLYMKHWKLNDTNIHLKFTINGDTDTTFSNIVDSLEATGGGNNMLSIDLRNETVSELNYYDFLKLGINRVDIELSPENLTDITSTTGYQLRALSVERE